MFSRSRARAAATVTLVSLAPAGALAQDDGAAFYKGRQLTFAVASTPGGGYDSYARLVGRHIGKYIPGHPTVVVTNMTGAGGHLVGRYIHSVAPRDGSWVAVVLPGTITGGL